MTDLPPVQYLEKLRADLDEATRQHMPAMVVMTDYLRGVLDRIAELEAKLPKETLEQVATRITDESGASGGEIYWFRKGFLRAAEMARKGELPDE